MRRPRHHALLVFALSTMAGVYFASQVRLAYPAALRPSWTDALAINLVYYWAWGAAVPVVAALQRRFGFAPGRRLRSAAAHLAAAIALTVAEILLSAIVLTVMGVYEPPFLVQAPMAVQVNFHSSFPTYWLILAVLVALDYAEKYRARDLRAAQLEHNLAQARLDALRLQLNPHFLFNALNSISALMFVDVNRAETMIRKLGELLRASLDRGHGPEITLADELDLLQRYLDIETIRFEDRMSVAFDVDPATRGALVPALVLQPLVENAVRHAVAARATGGRIEVSARRANGLLLLSVADDGPGPGVAPRAEGVGLGNTRERLTAIYGRTDALSMYTVETGGCRVELRLPFRGGGAEAETRA